MGCDCLWNDLEERWTLCKRDGSSINNQRWVIIEGYWNEKDFNFWQKLIRIFIVFDAE